MTDKVEVLEKLKRKIENAYYDRTSKNQKDYPPFKLTVFEDRPVYHRFIIKLIDEEIEEARQGY